MLTTSGSVPFSVVALALACTPEDPEGTGTTGMSALASTGAGATSSTGESSTTRGPDTTTTTTNEATTSTTGGDKCGDGVAEPGELCFDFVPIEGLNLHQFTVGDLDEDGHLDLVGVAVTFCPLVDQGSWLAPSSAPAGTPRQGANPFSVVAARGDGSGGFASAFVTDAPHWDAAAPTVADFTGDGHLDLSLIATDFDGSKLLVFAGDGAGALQGPLETFLPLPGRELAAGDLDGDDDVDLLVSGLYGLVALVGDGVGGFVPSVFAEAPQAWFDNPILHDLDGDGDLDLVVVRNNPYAIETYLGAGDGSFAPGIALALAGIAHDLALVDPAIGDRPALLVRWNDSQSGARIDAFEIVEDGSLAPPVVIDGVDGVDLAVGRFDGAPRPDVLAFGHASTFAVLGDEPWPPPAELLVSESLAIQSHLIVGDVNEDGVDDVVMPESGLRVFLSNP